MPRSPVLGLLLALAVAASACTAAGAPDPDPDSGPTHGSDVPTPTAAQSASPDPGPTTQAPVAGTDLDACEIVTAADIETVLDLQAGSVAEGELLETPTSLSPGHTECRYGGDWGGIIVSLTPEDGANLYRAARGSYADASDRQVAGADGAFWSANDKRGFFRKGAVTVRLQVTHVADGADREAVTVDLGQAAIDRID
jgi:hypothetical protein